VFLTLHHLQTSAEVFRVLWWQCQQFNKKKAYHCEMFVLPCSWRSSQTPPDMSSTYSTLRQCTAMPLQVGMEEGPMSKAVWARRKLISLLYCRTLYVSAYILSPTPRVWWHGLVSSMFCTTVWQETSMIFNWAYNQILCLR
jgi:hypothetical protein